MGQNVAIVGASKNPERYSLKAFHMLREYGHTVFPVTPKFAELEGVTAYARLSDIPTPIETVTMYVGSELSARMEKELLKLKPKRVIFNPGSENPPLMKSLEQAGIHVVEACTLVLLRTNQFLTA